ncbi:TetR family transcriptional regulator [Salinibacterium sp. SWN139]|uniref:TetR family transcriptional regulator n=1 Tax=Salinibacterium sp. SWN139 TaxID=2792055 RepID=UPI0018CD630F|nr:TetR family transcriptional regulator [Salinibacterium sp. SWN139]MBH0053352.1 TetR family transcriptional regulator [Salinibacterium sp. SWN139]
MRSRSDDSTTKARIRDAAIRLIGQNGFAATSARGVATEAGVSAGLVIHHFGSMRELKVACDDFIITEVTHRKVGMGEGDVSAAVSEWYADLPTFEPWLIYLGRLFTDDSVAGADLFDRLVAMSHTMLADGVASGAITPSADEHARAVLLVTHSLSSLTLQSHIARSLGSSQLSLDSLSRMGNAALELYTHGIYTPSTIPSQEGPGSGPTHDLRH